MNSRKKVKCFGSDVTLELDKSMSNATEEVLHNK